MAVVHGMLDPGNVMISAPYFIGGKSGICAALAAAADVFSVRNLGRLDIIGGGPIIGAPLRVSKIRVGFAAVTAYAAAAFAFEVHKVTGFSAQATGGTAVLAVARKTTGYQSVAATEVDAMIANTAALTPGTYTVVGSGNSPVMFSTGTANVDTSSGNMFPCFQQSWEPSDLCPLSIEQGEGLVVRNTIAQVTGTGRLFVCIDFLRQ